MIEHMVMGSRQCLVNYKTPRFAMLGSGRLIKTLTPLCELRHLSKYDRISILSVAAGYNLVYLPDKLFSPS